MKLYLVLFRDIVQRLRWRFPLLIAWTALVGIGEGVSVILLLPLLSRTGIAAASTQGATIRVLDKALALIGATTSLEIVAVIITITAVQTLLSMSLTWWTVSLARRYQGQRQVELFRAFMRAKWTFLVDRKGGEMTNAIVTECDRAGGAFTICLTLISSAVVTVIYAVLSLNIAWKVTLSLIGFAAIGALLMTQLYRKTSTLGRSLSPLNTEFQTVLTEHFAGVKFIKATDGVAFAIARIESITRKLELAVTTANSMPGIVRSLLEFLAFAGLACILVLASDSMGTEAGNTVVVLALFGRLFPRITALQVQMHHFNWNAPAVEVINRLQDAAEAEAERQNRPDEADVLRVGMPARMTVRGLRVEVGEHRILNGIDLELPMPGMTAVVGGSGAGKSTLAHALLGLVEPAAGSVTLGPHDFASAPLSAWRRAIGYVPQETILFHASVKDNLTLATPAASEAEIEVAARQAHAHEFIEALPQGYDTLVGDQGVKLSGGQRQRLGIARALLVHPRLLILDEAMSALDAASELEVLRTLEELRKKMGILLITHRIAAVHGADMIYVFEEGRIAENGTWDDLMRRGKRFFALARAQGLSIKSDNGLAQEEAGASFKNRV